MSKPVEPVSDCAKCDGEGAVIGDLVSVFDGSVIRKGIRVPCDCWDPLPDMFYAYCKYRERYEVLTDAHDAAAATQRLLAAGWSEVRQIDERSFLGTCPTPHEAGGVR